MSSTYGENIHLSIFGQSHSEAIGMTLDGIPAGQSIDFSHLNAFLARRAPGSSDLSTPRKEADCPEFLSGFTYGESSRETGTTCGAPVSAIIRNANTRSKDYDELKDMPRPGHADYTASVKYFGSQDHAGGGHFSGRLTAPLCIAGGICIQLLERQNIRVFARIYSIGDICDSGSLEEYLAKGYPGSLTDRPLPVIDLESGEKMRELILQKKAEGDSAGGIIECVITGLPAGLGDPMFDGMENRISRAVFAIPAVKGIEFGSGFASAHMAGSENNDEFCINNGRIETLTNNCGGILGGITDGMPLVFRAAFKPTPSIFKEQRSVIISEKKETVLKLQGRHDPCIVPRAVPCVEAAAALAVYDAYLGRKKEM